VPLVHHALRAWTANPTQPLTAAGASAARNVLLPPNGQAWFGSSDAGSDTATPIGGATPGSTNINVLESSVLNGARTVDVVHVYRAWTDVTGAFPGNTTAGVPISTHVANGKMFYIDWSPNTGPSTPVAGGWPAIVAGTHDAAIIAFADKIKAWGVANPGKKFWLGFGHESDLDIAADTPGFGSVAADTYENSQIVAGEFRAAYRHIYDVFNARGALGPVVWIWTAEGHLDDVHLWDAMYPGDDIIDWIGYDPYGKVEPTSAATTSRTWRASLGKQTGADPQGTYRFYAWATGLGATTNGLALSGGTRTLSKAGDQGKPIMASEYGSAYNPTINAANLATWRTFWDGGVTDMGAGVYPNIRAVLFFGSASSGQYDPRNDVGAGSIAAPDAASILGRFRAFAALSRFNAARPW
jgi:hypothetical protein